MTAASRPVVVVIGVGNPWRRDDGAGPAVATAARDRLDGEGRGVEVRVLDGEAARLIEAWDGADLAIVVDAVRTGATPGTLHRFDLGGHRDDGSAPSALTAAERAGRPVGAARLVEPRARIPSSHGLGVVQAVELALVLGRMPRRLVVVGVEGADFRAGTDLSPSVAAAAEPAARLIAGLIREATVLAPLHLDSRAACPMRVDAAASPATEPTEERV